MDPQQLLTLLGASLDAGDPARRAAAEAQLASATAAPGFAPLLAGAAAQGGLPLDLRQLAAVLLKNTCSRHWQEGERSFEPPQVCGRAGQRVARSCAFNPHRTHTSRRLAPPCAHPRNTAEFRLHPAAAHSPRAAPAPVPCTRPNAAAPPPAAPLPRTPPNPRPPRAPAAVRRRQGLSARPAAPHARRARVQAAHRSGRGGGRDLQLRRRQRVAGPGGDAGPRGAAA